MLFPRKFGNYWSSGKSLFYKERIQDLLFSLKIRIYFSKIVDVIFINNFSNNIMADKWWLFASLKFRNFFVRYGGAPEDKRLMIETGVNKTLVVEIYPLKLTVSSSQATSIKLIFS